MGPSDSEFDAEAGASTDARAGASTEAGDSTAVVRDRYRLRDGVRLAGDVLVSARPLTATRLNEAAVAVVEALDGAQDADDGDLRAFRSAATLAEETGADRDAVASLCERLHRRGFLAWRPARDPDDEPPVSIVVTVRNDRGHLRHCLDALDRLDYPAYEVVVVDDGSTDGTREAAASHPLADEDRLRVVAVGSPDDPLGIGASRNRGVAAASHEVIAFTDADCRPRPAWLADLVPRLVAFDLVGGRVRPAGTTTASAYEAHNASLDMGPYASRVHPGGATPYLATANLVGRRAVFESVPFPDRDVAEDVDVCWRALDAGFDVGYVPDGVVEHAYRADLRAFAGRRSAYGASEALLEREYGRKRKGAWTARVGVPLVLLVVAVIAMVGAAASLPVVALGVGGSALFVAALVGGLRRLRQYRRIAPAVAPGDVVRSWGREWISSAYAVSREVTRYYALPLAAVGLSGVVAGSWLPVGWIAPLGTALLVAVALAVALPLAVEYRVYEPDASVLGYAAYYLADHLGYQRGVYRGALAHRTLAHLRPDARFRLGGAGSDATRGRSAPR